MQTTRRDTIKTIGGAGVLTMLGGSGVAAVVGADDHQSDSNDSKTDGDSKMAKVRVAHASPDAPNVDVWVDGSKALSDVPFKTVSDYLDVPTGTRTVKITAAGDPSTVAFEGDLTLEAMTYTVAAVGELTSEDTEFKPWVLQDDTSTTEGKARVRLVHAAPDAPAVDVTVMDGETTLFDGVAYGESSDYLEVEPGQYTLEVRGDTDSNDGDVAATFDVTLEAGTTYTAFAEGYLTPDDEPASEMFDLVVAQDSVKGTDDTEEDMMDAMVRVAHASPDAPNVDVWVDDKKVLSDVPFKAVSDYLSLKPGTYTVKITAAGDPSTVAFEGDVTVDAMAYTVAAVGELTSDDTEFKPWILVDDASPSDDMAAVRLAHASPDAPAVDVTVMDGKKKLFSDVAFGEASDYMEVPAGSYTLAVWPAEDAGCEPVATFDVEVEGGNAYTSFAEGYLTPDDEPDCDSFDLVVTEDATN
ncbi:DUF4397 domain-containing protein [Haladaptatus sp. DFWS20]|uniref:DUF4397 domain-containing protein n=1 Tax=Haladaptatus sp. DFWS20 TaxID=3403467 RepID=UPI003EBD3843